LTFGYWRKKRLYLDEFHIDRFDEVVSQTADPVTPEAFVLLPDFAEEFAIESCG
jgi:hypothetical protein